MNITKLMDLWKKLYSISITDNADNDAKLEQAIADFVTEIKKP